MIDDDRAKLLRDMAIGQNVNAAMHPEEQWGIIRRQVLAICQSLGIEPNGDFLALNSAVEAAKQ
jgi:predicted transcriptional regulator